VDKDAGEKKEEKIEDSPEKKNEDEEEELDDEEDDKNKKEPEKLEGEDECYEYKLVGVTVHIGTADAGHYYSYINTMRGNHGLPSDHPDWGKTN
jgi:ubiquitin C-terminal hydrolase